MILTAVLLMLGCVLATLVLAWFYFRRYTIKRAPIGVINLRDVIYMMAAIILVPFLYLLLPRWAVAALLTVEAYGLIYLVWEPVLRRRLPIALTAAGLVGADLGAALLPSPNHTVFFAANDILLIVFAVGIASLWAQSGLKARDAALLGAFLIGYDFIATARLPLMTSLMDHLAGLPFSPLFAWPVGAESNVGIGLTDLVGFGMGDVLMATVFPLVMRKAFGRTAGLTAVALDFAILGAMFLWPVGTIVPAMVFLGPLMVAQYLYWRFRSGPERTIRQYLQAEPV